MIHIATVFDKNYLLRALALQSSLSEYDLDIHYWFMCLDYEASDLLEKMEIENLTAMVVDDINDPELLATRNKRNGIEFAMGSKASWLKYIYENGNMKAEDQLVFVDADILFFSNPTDIFKKVSKHSISITHHKFPAGKENLGEFRGYYNSGLIFLKNNEIAKKCINEWREQCIAWCSLVYEDGKHTDQLYLNAWPEKYGDVHILPDKGVNTGTWNIERFKITKNKDNIFFVDEDPLICYHYHGFRMYLTNNKTIRAYPITVHHKGIYNVYLNALQKVYGKISLINPEWKYGFNSKPNILKIIKQIIWKKIK